MIEMGKTYRTRDGREVRIYATDGVGEYCVQGAVRSERGWESETWTSEGISVDRRTNREDDLIPSDPHGILPRHRELLAAELFSSGYAVLSSEVEYKPFESFIPYVQAALIALARLDRERGE